MCNVQKKATECSKAVNDQTDTNKIHNYHTTMVKTFMSSGNLFNKCLSENNDQASNKGKLFNNTIDITNKNNQV